MEPFSSLRDAVKAHYEQYVYPQFPLWASVRTCDTYALNLDALWAWFNGKKLPEQEQKILLAGCGSFSPYPTAVANPKASITALDLSAANLRRARLHTWLHGYFNVDFIQGDIVAAASSDFLKGQRFHFIDCYGVLHHIPDVIAALNVLHLLLQPGGFVRIMVYSQGARKSAQWIKTAIKMLGIQTVGQLKRLCRKAPEGSRFKNYLDATPEAEFDSGLADLFLHPYAKAYTLEELLEVLEATGFEPLQFIHQGALPQMDREIDRLHKMQHGNQQNTNFIFFAGRKQDAEIRMEWQRNKSNRDTMITLNPVIKRSLSRFSFAPLKPQARLGFANPPIDAQGKRLLFRCRKPLGKSAISLANRKQLDRYLQALFLMETLQHPDHPGPDEH